MGTIQFNTHDLFLAMTVFQCLLFSIVLLLVNRNHSAPSKLILSAFLLAHALIAWHELSYYGNQFRYSVMDVSPNLLFIGNIAYFFDAVLLYLFVKAVLYKDFQFQKLQLLHVVPVMIFTLYLLNTYYLLEDLPKRMAIWNWQLTNAWHYISIDFIGKLLRVLYGLLCLKVITEYCSEQRQTYSNSSVINIFWLRAFVISFICVMLLELVLSAVKVAQIYTGINIEPLISLGLLTYYINLVLLATFLTYAIARLPTIIPIDKQEPNQENISVPNNMLGSIENYMKQEKPHLDPDITLNQLASLLGMSTKALSVTLNHHFQSNFYEFINRHRIIEAKNQLISRPEKSITDVYCDVGFNSKSVFYNFFKKYENMTPTAYRKEHAIS